MPTPCGDHDRWMGGCAGCEGATERAQASRLESAEATLDRVRGVVDEMKRKWVSEEGRAALGLIEQALDGK